MATNLVLDNQTLRDYAWNLLKYGVNGEPETSYDRFVVNNLRNRPDFQVLRDQPTLCEALVEAVDADKAFIEYRSKFLHRFSKSSKAELEAIRAKRDSKFDDYEVLRKLLESDNFSIIITKS